MKGSWEKLESEKHVGQRRGRSQASLEFQTKTHGGECQLDSSEEEGNENCVSEFVPDKREVRGLNFHTSSLVSWIVTPNPGKVGKMGRAIRLGICTTGSMLSQLCQGGWAGATWEPPGVLAGVQDQRVCCAHGIRTVKESETLSS